MDCLERLKLITAFMDLSLKVLFQAYNFITKRITRSHNVNNDCVNKNANRCKMFYICWYFYSHNVFASGYYFGFEFTVNFLIVNSKNRLEQNLC